MRLLYIGNGANVINIPAHDLTQSDLDAIAAREKIDASVLVEQLLNSGLYTVETPENDVLDSEDIDNEYSA